MFQGTIVHFHVSESKGKSNMEPGDLLGINGHPAQPPLPTIPLSMEPAVDEATSPQCPSSPLHSALVASMDHRAVHACKYNSTA